MRKATFILGTIGVLFSIAVAVLLFNKSHEAYALLSAMGGTSADAMKDPQVAEVVHSYYSVFGLVAASLLGIAGLVLFARGKSRITAGLLVVGCVLPAVLYPVALVGSLWLGIGGILAFFAKPRAQRQVASGMAAAA